ncbi:MAG: hypothetical protein BWK75_02045 [Candidatus Altiarchaeales archaeon A3]|nr:MAG: hypothetical protein BWK75_02045 [Candidatus Altiarchaeales archaeon A3]
MNIKNIVKKRLCCGCGTCIGICPADALKMEINEKGFYIPEINEKKCTDCSICSKVCPQINKTNNFDELNKFVFGKTLKDKVLGNYINFYTGHSTDENLRFEASSGGVVTQLLVTVLEKGIIDGALVTRMKKDDPLISEPFIARTKDEIISAMSSKYCPVPANVMLKEIIKSKKNEKFAVVGLPCHIIGIRKAEMINKKLQEKIVLFIGIFCTCNISFFGTDFILKYKGVKKENVKSIRYRGNGWPGCMQIEKNNGRNIILPHFSVLYFGAIFPCFTNINCKKCNDHISFFSDISIGDPWGIKKDPKGSSLLISRTVFGEQIIKISSNLNHIEIKDMKKDVLFIHPTIKMQQKSHNFFISTIKEFGFYFYSILFSNISFKTKILLLFNLLEVIINYRMRL